MTTDKGETDLDRLIAKMRPELASLAFTFGVVSSARDIPADCSVIATVHEDEGVTIVGLLDELARAKVECSGAWAKITLTVHSSLAAVGLTARVASALADHEISANVLAGYFHDHVFVQWEKRHQAMEVLRGLSPNAGGS